MSQNESILLRVLFLLAGHLLVSLYTERKSSRLFETRQSKNDPANDADFK